MAEERDRGARMTKVMRCKCEHAYQDKKHGKGMRVHNKKGGQSNNWVCTVCRDEKSAMR